jgi:hypothetical protein
MLGTHKKGAATLPDGHPLFKEFYATDIIRGWAYSKGALVTSLGLGYSPDFGDGPTCMISLS